MLVEISDEEKPNANMPDLELLALSVISERPVSGFISPSFNLIVNEGFDCFESFIEYALDPAPFDDRVKI